MKRLPAFCLAALTAALCMLPAAASMDMGLLRAPAIPLYATDAQLTEALRHPTADGEIALMDLSLFGSQLAALAVARPGAKVMIDTTLGGGGILSRTWIDPARTTVDGFVPGGLMDSDSAQAVAATFNAFFVSENLHAYELAHKVALPGSVHAAIWLGVDMGPTVFAYTYSSQDNAYKAISCYIDLSGYIHVEYDTGDHLVFSSAPLQYR